MDAARRWYSQSNYSSYPIMMLSLPYSRLALRGRRSISTNALVSRRCGSPMRLFSSQTNKLVPSSYYFGSALLAGATLLYTTNNINDKSNTAAQCSAASPLGSEPVMLSPTKEAATGILFDVFLWLSFIGYATRLPLFLFQIPFFWIRCNPFINFCHDNFCCIIIIGTD